MDAAMDDVQEDTTSSSASSTSGFWTPRSSTFDDTNTLTIAQDLPDNLPLQDANDDEQLDQRHAQHKPANPLNPTSVSLYLLSPYLKLGAILFPRCNMALRSRLVLLVCFALLATLSRHIWNLLARHLKKSHLEDIILDAFARGRRKEKRRRVFRFLIRTGTGSLRVFLAVVYLRYAVHLMLPFLPEAIYFPTSTSLNVAAVLLLIPFLLPGSLASKRIIIPTCLSISTYLAWFCSVLYFHATHGENMNNDLGRMGILWDGIAIIAFIFTSSPTVTLYSSLKSSQYRERRISTSRTPKSHSFRRLSILSTILGLILISPLSFVTQPPVAPEYEWKPNLSAALTSVFASLTLLLSLPSILVLPAASNPLPSLHLNLNLPVSQIFLASVLLFFSLLPDTLFLVLSDVLLVIAIFATYTFPALIHVAIHHFRRPLSIVIPHRAPTLSLSASLSADGGSPTREPLLRPGSPLPVSDTLLQRKETALQRKRLRKRIVWDIGAWALLVLVGAGSIVWVVGKFSGSI